MRAKPISPNEQLCLVMECRSSGLSDYQWCQMNGINSGTFYNWVSRLRKRGAAVPHCPNKTEKLAVVKQQSVVKMDLVPEPETFSLLVEQNACIPDSIDRFRNLLLGHPKTMRLRYFVGAEGDIELPSSIDMPEMTYLAYGSSITHGSLALAAPYTYPFRIAGKLKCDYLNLGFAGSAYLEKSIAEYLVSRKDWDFASVEMGINMIGKAFTIEFFEEQVKEFVNVLAADHRPVFATSIFGFNGTGQDKAEKFREIVRKHAEGRLIFTDGLELLNNPTYISQDLTHPSLEGVEEIVKNWSVVMKSELRE